MEREDVTVEQEDETVEQEDETMEREDGMNATRAVGSAGAANSEAPHTSVTAVTTVTTAGGDGTGPVGMVDADSIVGPSFLTDSDGLAIIPITASHDAEIARIIRANLVSFHLDIPGTAYFDPELDHLSAFYGSRADRRYFVVTDHSGRALGGAGLAEVAGTTDTAELQKLYLSDDAKGHRMGYALIERIEAFASAHGYRQLYVETHHRMAAANHIYLRSGFHRLAGPLAGSVHGGAMDRFYMKDVMMS